MNIDILINAAPSKNSKKHCKMMLLSSQYIANCMFKRLFNLPLDKQDSLFIFGPRGTGKTKMD